VPVVAGEPDFIREVYAAWNGGDVGRLGSYFAEGARYVTSGLFPGIDRVYVGPAGMRKFHADMLAAWERFTLDAEEVETDGELTVIRVRFDGKGRSSGIEVSQEYHHAVVIEGREIRFLAAAPSREAVLAAAARR
jgi:ketosteroid isomerase-like protein